jgi:Flp pilus assembly protein CpaB
MKRGRILVLLGIILGLVTMAGAFLLLQTAQQPTTPPEPTMAKVLVATQNLSQAQAMDPGAFEEREFEKSQAPADAVLSRAEMGGMLAAQDIAQGQILRRDMMTDKVAIVNKGVNASFLIPEGKVAMAFPITELSSVAYALQAGDSVDMILTVNLISVDPATQIREPVMRVAASGAAAAGSVMGEQIPRMVTQLTIQDVTVLKIGPWGQQMPAAAPTPGATPQPDAQATPAPAGPTIMTVVLDTQDALVLKFAREAGASIDFVLRGRNYHEIIATEPVTLEYMMQRFNIKPPEKLPYALDRGGSTYTGGSTSGSSSSSSSSSGSGSK